MQQDKTVYTSISISNERSIRLKECGRKLCVVEYRLLSVLAYKAGMLVCKEAKCFQTTEYQKRGDDYQILPVRFFCADHEYLHANRLACKISVSKLISIAIDLFLDEIMENGINPMEIAHLRVIENSYKKKSYNIRNFSFKITKSDQFDEYIMKMRMEKT